MNITLKKIDWIRWTIYLITVIFLAYLIFICFFAKPDQFLFGNVFIKPVPIDFGGFGSLLAGIFSPLAFLWLVLNFRQQDKNLQIAEQQLKILEEDRQAQNEIIKPELTFTDTNVDSLGHETKTLSVLLSFLCASDRELKDCNIKVNDHKSPLYFYNKFSLKNEDKSGTIYTIHANTPSRITLKLDLQSLKEDEMYIWSVELSYINSNGYKQVESFEIVFLQYSKDKAEPLKRKFYISQKFNVYRN